MSTILLTVNSVGGLKNSEISDCKNVFGKRAATQKVQCEPG